MYETLLKMAFCVITENLNDFRDFHDSLRGKTNRKEKWRKTWWFGLITVSCRVEVEKMIATGMIDMVVETTNYIYVLELKLSNNGGIDAATEQMRAKQYAEPFKADKRKLTALAIELDEKGKGLVDWKEVVN